MKISFIGIGIVSLILAFLLPSCDRDEYLPLSVNTKSCNIEIECVKFTGASILTDRSFIDNIKIEGENSHSMIKYSIQDNRLCFEADLPDQNEMEWTSDRREATGISRITIYFGKQKVSLRCMIKYTANRPPAAPGGTMTLQNVEYNGQYYRRAGNAVTLKIQFKDNGKL